MFFSDGKSTSKCKYVVRTTGTIYWINTQYKGAKKCKTTNGYVQVVVV